MSPAVARYMRGEKLAARLRMLIIGLQSSETCDEKAEASATGLSRTILVEGWVGGLSGGLTGAGLRALIFRRNKQAGIRT